MNTKGTKTFQKFQELNIVTGKIGNNEIAAWFDTLDKDILYFLDWFQDNITQENVLSCSESMAEDEFNEKKVLLEGHKLERAKQEVESSFPGIFDRERNEFELEFLRDEEKLQEDILEYTQSNVSLLNQKKKDLKKTKSDKMRELVNVNFKRDEAASNCLQLAEDLDHVNANIGEQLVTSWNSFTLENSNIHRADNGNFLCQIDFKPHNDYIHLFNLEVVNMFKSDFDKSLQQKASRDDLEESILNNSAYENSCDAISTRLIKSYEKKITNLWKVEVIQAKIDFLDDVNDLGFNSMFNNQQRQMLTKRNLLAKETAFKEAVSRRVKQYMKLPTIVLGEKELGAIKQKLKYYTDFETIFKEILQCQTLLMKLLSTEISVFGQLKSFNAYVRGYINSELYMCELRIGAMNSHISKHADYLAMPIEDKWHPLKTILRILDVENTNVTLTNALDIIHAFYHKYEALERKLFVDDVYTFRRNLNKIETNNQALRLFLSSSATKQVTIIPYHIYEVLVNANDAIETQNKTIKCYMNMPKEAAKKIGRNKWLKYKRQLWMYFLKKPEKIDMILDELEKEIRKTRAEYLIN